MENLEICKKCGGMCCKKSGCDYLSSDFNDLSFNGLLKTLSSENISIVSALIFEKLPNNKIYANPFLYLRARNTNREIIDLLSMKTTCSLLTDAGCKYSYNERPSMGKYLVPVENNQCYPLKDPNIVIESWKSYQKVLSKVVKKITGLSVDEKLKQDAENLFYDILMEKFNGIDIREIADVKNMMINLSFAFPDEFHNAIIKTSGKVYTKV